MTRPSGAGPAPGPGCHPRISVSGLCFPALTAVEQVAAVAALGCRHTSLTAGKIRDSGPEAIVAACRAHSVNIVSATGVVRLDLERPEQAQAAARDDIDQAAAVGARSLYTLTGPRPFAGWDLAAAAYARFTAELVPYAAQRSVRLAVEPTNWLYSDLNFVHSFHDATGLARASGLRVCLDLFHTWTEAGLREELRRDIHLVSTVQLSDMVTGSRALPCRTVPGDGAVPLDTLIGWILEAGYDDVFELELNGPRVDELGHTQAARLAVGWLDAALRRAGA